MARKRTPSRRRTEPGAAEAELNFQLKALGLPQGIREFQFAPPRRWRFDLAWPQPKFKLAVEIEGGVFGRWSRHTTGAGFRADLEKYNRATALGWKVFRFLPEQVKSGLALRTIEEFLPVASEI